MRISSTITRAQTEARNIPRLPKILDEMDPEELLAFCKTQRENRIQATEKRRAVRSKNKAKKAEALAAATATTPEPADDSPATEENE